ncbi:MAG: anion permease [Candidatus Methylacidiphilales bacterium]|nr:inorganic phosphate transporter [Candidatus Methylacidiphilales bacterium]
MLLLFAVLLAALAFEFINGFHDTANAIATVVSTKVLTPRAAILLAAAGNLLGALTGTAVASTIGSGLVDIHVVTTETVLNALLAAIIWGLITWWLGLPSSSSHALVGGLCGAALSASNLNWEILKWSQMDATGHATGLWPKVILPMIASPLIGFIFGLCFMYLLLIFFYWMTPYQSKISFGRLQLASAAFMAFSHGSNDAQKTMGIIALALFSATTAGTLNGLPEWLFFLHTPKFEIHAWVVLVCAVTMAVGTSFGGWRIIRTMGHRMVKLQPVHGFAAETSAAVIINVASHFGIPVSTTHVIATSIMGVGATKRLSAVKWGVVGRMVWAWVLTLPVTAALAYGLQSFFKLF